MGNITEILVQLGPWGIFMVIIVKLAFDWDVRRKEKIDGKHPKDVTRDKIHQLWDLFFFKDPLGNVKRRKNIFKGDNGDD